MEGTGAGGALGLPTPGYASLAARLDSQFSGLWFSKIRSFQKKNKKKMTKKNNIKKSFFKMVLRTFLAIQWLRFHTSRDFPGGPVAKTSFKLTMQGIRVQSLVRELNPTCCN